MVAVRQNLKENTMKGHHFMVVPFCVLPEGYCEFRYSMIPIYSAHATLLW